MAKQGKDIVEDIIWQNHENRLTKLEMNYESISKQVEHVEHVVKKESEEQKKLLNRLIDHHLDTNIVKINNFWKFMITLVSTGGLIYLIIKFLLERSV